MTAVLLEMCIMCVKAGCEIWLTSYVSKHTSQYLSDKPFGRTYTRNFKTTGYIWTFCISNNCSTIEDVYCVVRAAWEIPLESYGPKQKLPSFSSKKLCAYTAYLYTCITMYVQVCMTMKLMYLMTAYYTPNDGFTANNILYKSKVG